MANPDATAATVVGDGWLQTGDLGRVDDEGYLFIGDRLKELIKYKGFQVAPAELEILLCAHPAVADAVVVGLPDEEAGEVPAAFVVARTAVTSSDLMDFVAHRVALHKRIRRVEIAESIPRTPAGKVLRRVLRESIRGKGREQARKG